MRTQCSSGNAKH